MDNTTMSSRDDANEWKKQFTREYYRRERVNSLSFITHHFYASLL